MTIYKNYNEDLRDKMNWITKGKLIYTPSNTYIHTYIHTYIYKRFILIKKEKWFMDLVGFRNPLECSYKTKIKGSPSWLSLLLTYNK